MPSRESLLAAHAGALGRVAAVYARAPAEREDLLQEILLASWQALSNFRGESSARTFLLRVAHNRAMSWVSRRRTFDPEVETAGGRGVDSILEQHEQRRSLEVAVRSLPNGQRQVVALALEGLSHAEIGEVLGITEGNVAVRLSRARSALRSMLGGTHER